MPAGLPTFVSEWRYQVRLISSLTYGIWCSV